MIGVAKNQKVSRFASRSRRSRKCTVSAESSSARTANDTHNVTRTGCGQRMK
ncbi:hypothetical protein D3C83_61970 [compost metagenome]